MERKKNNDLMPEGYRITQVKRIMKLVSLCLILGINILFAKESYTQTAQISLDMKNVSLENVFDAIKKQSEFVLFYSNDQIDLNKKVNIKVNKANILEVLSIVLKDQYDYKIEDRYVLISKKVAGISSLAQEAAVQDIVIKGRVSDPAGEPLIGVSIVVVGTTLGTITDFNGDYSISVPNQTTKLRFSYVGYHPYEVTVGARTIINVNLDETPQGLGEVVVVGYGLQKKVNLTGAVAVVDGDDLKNRPVHSVTNMLQGLTPGLTVTTNSGRPGNSGKINIRGVNSINGGNPLVLVDGIEGDLAKVNPNDVESISVLKDASAAAVYGGRASYGVILLTTKSGNTSGKTTINYSGRVGWQEPTTSTEYETRGYYSVYLNDMFMKSYSGVNYTRYTEKDYDELYARINDKTEHPDRPWVTIDQRDGRDTYVYYANTDWYHWLYKDKRPMQSHSVSLRGGNDKSQWLISGNYHMEDGIMRQNTDEFYRANLRAKLSIDLNKWMKFTNNMAYYKYKYTYPGQSGVNSSFTYDKVHALASFVPMNPDGTGVYNTSFTNYQLMDGWPLIALKGKHRNKDLNDNITNTSELKYSPIKDLTFVANFNYSFNSTRYQNRQVNGEYSKYPGEILTIANGRFEDKLTESFQTHDYYAVNAYGTYEKTLNQSHAFKVMAGYNWETKNLKDFGATGYSLLSEELDDLKLVSTDADGNRRFLATGGQNEYAIMGYFARLNYDYAGKYLAEASGRYDGTSRFKRGDRYAFFPSFSLGWRVSEEAFFTPARDLVDNLKLRFSYGSLGNQQVGYYEYIQEINLATLDYLFGQDNKGSYASISNPVSSGLTWETVLTKNIGLDVAMLDNRLSFTGDAYIRDTKNMLAAGKTLPAVYGVAPPKENVADLRTKGYELSIGWKDSFALAGKPFTYNASVVFNDYVTNVTKYDNPTKNIGLKYYEGMRWGEIWGYRIDGYFLSDEEAANWEIDQRSVNDIIEQSAGAERGKRAGDLKFRDLDGDKKISLGENVVGKSGDREVIGNEAPRYQYGMNLGFSYAGLDFSAFFQGIGQQHWYPGANSMAFWSVYARPYATYIPKDFHKDIWSEDNPNAYYPRPRGYVALQNTNRELTAVNDKYLQDLAYCRLKNLTVGYTLPKQLTRKLLIENVRVYFSGENLALWTKLRSDYIDPEMAAEGGTGSLARIYPWSKSFTFGIDLTF